MSGMLFVFLSCFVSGTLIVNPFQSMKQHLGGKVFNGRVFERMKVLWLLYNMAVK
jgi:hypothetical protein